jgi:hypothetical protein
MEEFKLQAQCFQWHWNNYPDERGLLFTVNNNSGSRKEGAVMKAMGVVAGVSDMIYLQFRGPVFLEFKTATGRQSPAQKRFQEIVESQGYQYHIIRNFHDFRTATGK